MYILQKIQSEIESQLEKLTGKKPQLTTPPNPEMGDFAVFSKEKLNIPKIKGIKEIKVMGPYNNLFLDYDYFAEQVLKEAVKKDYGKGDEKKIVAFEYSAPNPNKPQHIGHVRNDVLGMAVSNILEFSGNKVYRINWINNTGIHICKAMLAYQKWGKGKTPKDENMKPDHFVAKYYVMFGKEAEKNPSLKEEAQEMLRKWEGGDREVRNLWKKIVDWAYEGWEYTYKKLGCKFDKWYYESELYKEGHDIIQEEVKKNGVLKRDKDNSIYADLKQYNLPNIIVVRKDGTALYQVPDFALWLHKYNDFHPNTLIACVGAAHKLYFQQLFKMFELIGRKWAKDCYHLSYGMVSLPEGKMSSRSGVTVFADDLIADVEKKAVQEIEKRGNAKNVQELAEQIGVGAIKFSLLKIDANKDIIFDKQQAVSFEGDTGPYVQYAYARCCRILEKEKPKGEKVKIVAPEEKNLLKKLAEFPPLVENCAKHYATHTLAQYLLDLTHTFSKFYDNCPVLTGENKDTRLQLVSATKNVLKLGLNLLGIEAPERM